MARRKQARDGSSNGVNGRSVSSSALGHTPTFKVIVVGASAGGVEAIRHLVEVLPENIPAAICIVLHIPATGPSFLPAIINRATRIPAQHVTHDVPLAPGRIYVAPPNCHLLIKPGRAVVGRGPKENNVRPSVDALFRSAARSYGPWAIGVILSGGLDDGTIGLREIVQRGGAALVQDPNEALFPSMCQSAMQNVKVDHVLPISELSPVLAGLAHTPVAANKGAAFMARRQKAQVPDIAEVGTDALKTGDFSGPPSAFTCPECGGALWELQDGKLLRYRCHVGHGYTAETFVAAQSEKLEDALWTALRALEEHAAVRRRLAGRLRRGNMELLAVGYEEQAELAERRAGLLRRAMMDASNGNGSSEGRAIERKAGRSHDRSPGTMVSFKARQADVALGMGGKRRAGSA